MQYETHSRSILKAVSWRTWATITTAVIVYIFTGEFALAITVGLLEVVAKMALYVAHERIWQKIRYGKKELPAFVLWFTGLPASGKKAIGDAVFRELKKMDLRVERIDARDVRPLFPETGFSPPEVDRHVRRSGHLAAMLEKNGICVVASFVSPYRKSRDFARTVAENFIEVHLKTTVEACEERDRQGLYRRARAGEFDHFPGVQVRYEEPPAPEILIEVDRIPQEQAVRQIVDYVRKRIIQGKRPAAVSPVVRVEAGRHPL